MNNQKMLFENAKIFSYENTTDPFLLILEEPEVRHKNKFEDFGIVQKQINPIGTEDTITTEGPDSSEDDYSVYLDTDPIETNIDLNTFNDFTIEHEKVFDYGIGGYRIEPELPEEDFTLDKKEITFSGDEQDIINHTILPEEL